MNQPSLSPAPHVSKSEFRDWKSLSDDFDKVTFELNTLIYRLSYDFNAPLSSVLGLIDLIELEHGDMKDIKTEYLGLIRGRMHRMRDILRDLLYSSRMQNQRTVIETTDLEAVIHREMLELSESNNFNRIKFTAGIQGGHAVNTDLFRLRIILKCLISNAINYANLMETTPWVKIHARCGARNTIITVKDNGIGIAADQQQKVFEMFYRGTQASNGSGLGLFLVQKAVHQLGGIVWLKSEPGNGTVVRIVLPNTSS